MLFICFEQYWCEYIAPDYSCKPCNLVGIANEEEESMQLALDCKVVAANNTNFNLHVETTNREINKSDKKYSLYSNI